MTWTQCQFPNQLGGSFSQLWAFPFTSKHMPFCSVFFGRVYQRPNQRPEKMEWTGSPGLSTADNFK